MRINISASFVVLIQVIICCLLTSVGSEVHTTAQTVIANPVHAEYNETSSEHTSAEAVHGSASAPEIVVSQKLEHLAELPEDAVPVTEIHSSFDEVPPPQKLHSEAIVQNDELSAVINQGTVSQDLLETETVGVVSLADTATAELQQRAASLSSHTLDGEQVSAPEVSNTTLDSDPPVIILPASGTERSRQVLTEPNTGSKKNEVPLTEQEIAPETAPPPVVRAEPKIVESRPKISEGKGVQEREKVLKKEDPSSTGTQLSDSTTAPPQTAGSNIDAGVAVPPETPQEDIPSFSEWTQKQLEEAEKKKGQNKTASSGTIRGSPPSKVRSKNYASPDCGAKVVSTNPEAENPSGILSSSKDEYLINKCSTQRMWVIIELCEAIQAKKLELANFELFSSSPRDFSVSLSHNYPSREWSSVGHFTARDERTVQSFNLHPHLFGKFLKVEFNTHYGREHFCCTSLIRVYGTSEFEVLETENEVHHPAPELEEEDEDELPIGAEMGKPTTNLFGHATNAVYSIVKKAAEVLVKGSDSQNQSSTEDEGSTTALIPSHHLPRQLFCSTLRHLVVCNNCSEAFFDRVYHLLSCHSRELQALIETPFVLEGINSSQLCSLYGLDFMTRHSVTVPLRLKHEDQIDQAGYLAAMLPPEYVSALCNILAVLERKVVLNMSGNASPNRSVNLTLKPSQDARDLGFKKLLIDPQVAQTCSLDTSFTSQCQSQFSGSKTVSEMQGATSAPGRPLGTADSLSVASQIKPTKTFAKGDANVISVFPSEELSSSIIDEDSYKSSSVLQSKESTVVQPSIQSSSTKDSVKEAVPSTSNDHVSSTAVPSGVISEESSSEQSVVESSPLEKELTDPVYSIDTATGDEQDQSKDLDALFMEMKALDSEDSTTESSSQSGGFASTPSSVTAHPPKAPSQQGQKESVFLRLSNKIKALERNMSLSGQYLEELSRRYKKQEELGRALNKTLLLLREELKRTREKEQQRDVDINILQSQIPQLIATVESLQSERDSWQHKAAVISQHLVLIVIEVLMFGVVVWVCRRLPNDPSAHQLTGAQRKWSTGWRKLSRVHHNKQTQLQVRRRSSVEGLGGHYSPQPRKRRPSEEALNISGSYKDLLLQDDNVVVVHGVDMSPAAVADSKSWLSVGSNRDQRRRRRRRKDILAKSSSSCNLNEQSEEASVGLTRRISMPVRNASLSPQVVCDELSPVTVKTLGNSSHSGCVLPSEECVSETAITPSSVQSSATGTEHKEGNGEVENSQCSALPYIETAISSRSRRSFNLGVNVVPQNLLAVQEWRNNHDGDSGSSLSQQSSHSKVFDDQTPDRTSSQSDSRSVSVPSANGERKKKVAKKGGLKNMVKKFF